MKGEKNWIWILMALVICYAGSCTRVWAQEKNEQTEDVKLLQARINELEEIVKAQENTISRAEKALNRLRKELDEQIEENKRLLTLCKEAGIDTGKPAEASFDPGEIVYRGKKRNQKWFDEMYKRFHDKIFLYEDKYMYIDDLPPNDTFNPAGSFRYWEVLSDLGNGEVLIRCSGGDITYHIYGLERNFYDGEAFGRQDLLYICTGSFKYTSARGRHKTVRSFCTYKPLTKKQFAEAISGGFELIVYKKVGEKIIKKPIR